MSYEVLRDFFTEHGEWYGVWSAFLVCVSGKSFKEAAGSLSLCVIELGFGQLECATSFLPLWHGSTVWHAGKECQEEAVGILPGDGKVRSKEDSGEL